MAYNVLNQQDFEQELADAGDNLVVIDFYANWCGPCKLINPYLQELSIQYANQAKFLKVNVDDCEDIAMAYNITSMPTFVFVKDNKIIDIMVGSNTDKLEKNIEKHVNGSQADMKKIQNAGQVKYGSQTSLNSLDDDSEDDESPASMLEVIMDEQI